MHLRRGTWYKLRNFIVYGFGTRRRAVDVDANTAMTANIPTADWPTNMSIESSVFFGGPLARTESAIDARRAADGLRATTTSASTRRRRSWTRRA